MAKRVLFIHAAGKKSHPLGSGKLIASLKAQLGSDYEVLAPDMPDPDHPGYKAWRDQIEQELGKLNADVLLIGHSFGGSVLLKYLAEGTDPRPIAGLFLVAVPCWGKRDWELEYTLPEDFASHLPPISQIFMYHSRHDEVVPFSHLRRYQEQLPQATVRELDGKEHSFTRGLPELVRDLKSLLVLQPHLCDRMKGKQGEGGRDGSVSLNRRSAQLGGSFRRSSRSFSAVL